jgi:hypothetical protein
MFYHISDVSAVTCNHDRPVSRYPVIFFSVVYAQSFELMCDIESYITVFLL